MIALWWTWQGFAIAVGLVIGSFLNVCIARMPEDRSVVWPGSHCERCGHAIRWTDNIPVVSYLILRGRCRDCAAPIGALHPLIELLGGLLSWLTYRRFVPDPSALDAAHLTAWAVWFGFVCLLVVASFVDLRHRIIPDETSIFAAPAGVLAALGLTAIGYDGWLAIPWRQAVLGAAVGGGFFAGTSLIARLIAGREALGWGDVKLMAMIGAFLGPLPGVFFVTLLGSVIGSITGIASTLYLRRRVYLPFGPALAAAALVYVFYGDLLIRAFLPTWGAWL